MNLDTLLSQYEKGSLSRRELLAALIVTRRGAVVTLRDAGRVGNPLAPSRR
jgi:hypothetical protein